MSNAVGLDASALLCLLHGQLGAERVAEALPSAVIGAANMAEVVTKMRERGLSAEEVGEAPGGLDLDVRPLTSAHAHATGHLRPETRARGLSLGDRTWLALAMKMGALALTADQAWASLQVGVEMEVVR